MKHLSDNPPYGKTVKNVGQSKFDIEEMLKQFGAKALRWTETPASMEGKECPILEFILEVELNGVQKRFGVRIQPPLFEVNKRASGRYGGHLIHTPNMNASMRLLYWYLKARLEATKWGLEDITETFMSKIMVALPEGGTSTMGEVMKDRPEILNEMLPSFEIKEKQLTDRRQEMTA